MNGMTATVFGLFGGLAMFLYGMNAMSGALEKAAGDGLRKALALLTKTPLTGALAGAAVTAILQSSSAATVMAVGFTSAGLMGLPQAVSVIFGANIGATATAQLLAFPLDGLIYPLLFAGFLFQLLGKGEKLKSAGTALFCFGLLFEGIKLMGDAMEPLAASPLFIRLMGQVADAPVLGVALGAVMTALVQSSSATIAVLQRFASQAGPDAVTSVIGLAGALPILLGSNIGTTVTAILAALGQSRDAKRAALAHCLFNLTGTALFLLILPAFARFVILISPAGPETAVIARQIANAHTVFNTACTLLWLPMTRLMVKLVTLALPDGDGARQLVRHEQTYRPSY